MQEIWLAQATEGSHGFSLCTDLLEEAEPNGTMPMSRHSQFVSSTEREVS